MGYLLVTAVLVVAFGPPRRHVRAVRMYNAGFVIFTVGSLLLALTPFTGPAGRSGSSACVSCKGSAARSCSQTRKPF